VSTEVDPPRLFAVVGATGTGKSEMSLSLAEALAERGRPAEIVNADAMQLYRGMDIGTAKLPVGERRGIPHHLLDVLNVTDEAAVAWYQGAARTAIEGIRGRRADAILVGGSGLYISSVLFDFRFPPRDEALRADLEAELERDGPGVLRLRSRSRRNGARGPEAPSGKSRERAPTGVGRGDRGAGAGLSMHEEVTGGCVSRA